MKNRHQPVPVSQCKLLNDLAVTVGSAPRISHSVSRNENKASQQMSRNENIDVCSVWSLHGLWRHAFQITTRLSQQFVKHALGCLDHALVLFYERHRDSEDNWSVHERCRESSRVALPVRRGFTGSSQQASLWHLSLAFFEVSIEGVLGWPCRTF